eukprot:4582288-Prorocentrum_lima.AAC.1
MTSSLVGSEMCIRDSPSAVQGNSRGSLLRSAPHHTPRLLGSRSTAWRYSCLLYTSDAADDM